MQLTVISVPAAAQFANRQTGWPSRACKSGGRNVAASMSPPLFWGSRGGSSSGSAAGSGRGVMKMSEVAVAE